MSARDRILAKLKAGAPAENRPAPDVAGWFAGHRLVETRSEKAARFRRLIELAHAEVVAVNAENWVKNLNEILHTKGLTELLVAPGTDHGQQAMSGLSASGIACKGYDQAIEAWKDEMFHHTPASLTTARAAIAETGTLVLWPDADEPRLMSLVPPVHIVLLDAGKIYNTFYEAMQSENWKDGLPTNALLISGPSKTADIQVTLAYGAHGPKELVVLLMGEAA
ncbi:MAG: lactate utilization protein [Candidatus Dechloromonas phosphoritropha]